VPPYCSQRLLSQRFAQVGAHPNGKTYAFEGVSASSTIAYKTLLLGARAAYNGEFTMVSTSLENAGPVEIRSLSLRIETRRLARRLFRSRTGVDRGGGQ
jgi:hypothetical protein